MTRHDIIELADQCGATLLDGWDVDMLTRFAQLVAQYECKQGPVAWMTNESLRRLRRGGNSAGAVPVHPKPSMMSRLPLYTHPRRREWQGLTEQEAAACWSASAVDTWKAIEAALKERNS